MQKLMQHWLVKILETSPLVLPNYGLIIWSIISIVMLVFIVKFFIRLYKKLK